MTHNTFGKLLKCDKGQCRYGRLYFKDGDLIEVDHILPLSLEGARTFANLQALHRYCHDQRHSEMQVKGIHDKDYMVEEPCAEKLARAVLETSRKKRSAKANAMPPPLQTNTTMNSECECSGESPKRQTILSSHLCYPHFMNLLLLSSSAVLDLA